MCEPITASLAQNVTWTVSNLCRGKPVPDLDIVKVFIRPLVDILDNANEDPTVSENSDIRTDTAWALSYLSDGEADRIQAVVTSGALPTLMKMVKDFPTNRTFMIPTIRCLGNFVTGNDTQTDAVLRAGFLDHAIDLLDHQSVRLDSCCASTECDITKLNTSLTIHSSSCAPTESHQERHLLDSFQYRCRYPGSDHCPVSKL
jgi:hypothetical protein